MNIGNVNVNEQCSTDKLSGDWAGIENHNHIQDKHSDSEEASAFEPDDDSKIKPEVELKEETDGFVYKADFRGHLQLVSLSHGVPNQFSATETNPSDELTNLPPVNPAYDVNYQQEFMNKKCYNSKTTTVKLDSGYRISDPQEQWTGVKSILPTSEDGPRVVVSWEETEHSNNNHVYRQLKNMSDDSVEDGYYIKEEPTENNPRECSYVHTLPEIYDYSSDSTWEHQIDRSSQLPELPRNVNQNGNMILLTQAEKKRLYRMRIKEENPTMWSTIKKREAARKREQREKRRHVLFEMQRAMEFSNLPDSPEVTNHKLYLEALKERYPELWNQLINALPATQIRNEQLYNERNPKSRRHYPKPAKMYKDVIEAQKKRLYRQRIKEERPEMYARQKARDAYARSLQRLVMKKKVATEKNGFNVESLHPDQVEKKLTYLHNLQVEHIQYMETERMSEHFSGELLTVNPNPSLTDGTLPAPANSCTKSDPSTVCDNDCSEDSYDVSKSSMNTSDSNISDGEKSKEEPQIHEAAFPKTLSAACSTQSDILWYWNDVKGGQYSENMQVKAKVPYVQWRKGPQVLTEEERLQKILKERMQLKEKRRRYRLNMTPEKRTEFLEIERERLKAYRLKKKAASLLAMESMQTKMACVDQ